MSEESKDFLREPCVACGCQFVVIHEDEGKDIAYTRCYKCAFMGGDRFKDFISFPYLHMKDEDIFDKAYATWDEMNQIIRKEMEENPKKSLSSFIESDKEEEDEYESLQAPPRL